MITHDSEELAASSFRVKFYMPGSFNFMEFQSEMVTYNSPLMEDPYVYVKHSCFFKKL
jgi:hypothetical protein